MRIILTINVPEEEQFLTPFTDLVIIRNVRPLGYSANHNQAFASWESDFFLVLNPDIRLGNFEIFSLASRMGARTLVCAPVVRSSRGSIEDSARRFPTSLGMLQRVLLKSMLASMSSSRDKKILFLLTGLRGCSCFSGCRSIASFKDLIRGFSCIWRTPIFVVEGTKWSSRLNTSVLRAR